MRVVIDGADQFRNYLAGSRSITEQELKAALTEALLFLERETKENTPVGASGGGGGLRNSIGVRQPLNQLFGFVGTSVPYAKHVEIGTRPHFPPPAALYDWVRKVLDVPEKDVPGVAFLVARKISKRGTKGKFMFRDAIRSSTPLINRRFNIALENILNRVNE